MMGPRHRGPLRPGSPKRCRCGAMVEGSDDSGGRSGTRDGADGDVARLPGTGVCPRDRSVRPQHTPRDVARPVEEPADPPEGYTPTQRDLPVVNRGDTLQVTVDPASLPIPQQTD